MAPWGGHPVFPELYRDMRHPFKFTKSSNISFLVTYLLDFSIGATGYLMYGLMVDDSIVKSIMQNQIIPNHKFNFMYLNGYLTNFKITISHKTNYHFL